MKKPCLGPIIPVEPEPRYEQSKGQDAHNQKNDGMGPSTGPDSIQKFSHSRFLAMEEGPSIAAGKDNSFLSARRPGLALCPLLQPEFGAQSDWKERLEQTPDQIFRIDDREIRTA